MIMIKPFSRPRFCRSKPWKVQKQNFERVWNESRFLQGANNSECIVLMDANIIRQGEENMSSLIPRNNMACVLLWGWWNRWVRITTLFFISEAQATVGHSGVLEWLLPAGGKENEALRLAYSCSLSSWGRWYVYNLMLTALLSSARAV